MLPGSLRLAWYASHITEFKTGERIEDIPFVRKILSFFSVNDLNNGISRYEFDLKSISVLLLNDKQSDSL